MNPLVQKSTVFTVCVLRDLRRWGVCGTDPQGSGMAEIGMYSTNSTPCCRFGASGYPPRAEPYAPWRAAWDSNPLPHAVLRVCFRKHLLPIYDLGPPGHTQTPAGLPSSPGSLGRTESNRPSVGERESPTPLRKTQKPPQGPKNYTLTNYPKPNVCRIARILAYYACSIRVVVAG